MTLEENNAPNRDKDEASIERLRQLAKKLCSDDISVARLAGHNLSWLQEDGLAILTQTLFGDYSRNSKKAAAYGLRSMNGRMKKLAEEVLEKGLKNRDRTTKAVCIKALFLMRGGDPDQAPSGGKRRQGNTRIKEYRHKGNRRQDYNASYNKRNSGSINTSSKGPKS